MAKGRKTGGKNFPKGTSGNPKGRTPVPPEVKEARKYTSAELELSMTKLLTMPLEDLKEVSENPRSSTIDSILSKILLRARRDGSYSHVNFFIERMFGKVPDKMQMSGSLNAGLVGIIGQVQKTKKALNDKGNS